jgi:hypothetical protein
MSAARDCNPARFLARTPPIHPCQDRRTQEAQWPTNPVLHATNAHATTQLEHPRPCGWCRERPRRKVGSNIFLSREGKAYRVRFRGADPLTGDRVQRTKRFPSDTPIEEIEPLSREIEARS